MGKLNKEMGAAGATPTQQEGQPSQNGSRRTLRRRVFGPDGRLPNTLNVLRTGLRRAGKGALAVTAAGTLLTSAAACAANGESPAQHPTSSTKVEPRPSPIEPAFPGEVVKVGTPSEVATPEGNKYFSLLTPSELKGLTAAQFAELEKSGQLIGLVVKPEYSTDKFTVEPQSVSELDKYRILENKKKILISKTRMNIGTLTFHDGDTFVVAIPNGNGKPQEDETAKKLIPVFNEDPWSFYPENPSGHHFLVLVSVRPLVDPQNPKEITDYLTTHAIKFSPANTDTNHYYYVNGAVLFTNNDTSPIATLPKT